MESVIVALAASVPAAVASIIAAWLARGARSEAREAKQNSSAAQENTKAVGNGFASHTTASLARIEGLIVAHLASHAEHDLKRGSDSS